MVTDSVRALLAEPRAAEPPARVWRDWALVAVLVPTALLEGIFRETVEWRWLATVVTIALVPTLLWRRTYPLPTVAVMFGAAGVINIATLVADAGEVGLNTMAFALLIPYALYRWGSGVEIAIGTAIILVPASTSLVAYGTLEESLGGSAVLIASAALGVALRYRTNARSRELEQIRTLERGELARELHDTVAHHVSAIAIQAQAGLAVAPTDPAAARAALEVIEAEASRTLAEMRSMVRVLRAGVAADFAPQRGVADLEQLAALSGGAPRVEVQREGDLSVLPRPVEVAIYRIAQESVTNAVRHARNPNKVVVRVCGDTDSVRLHVHDDGEGGYGRQSPAGYGLLGMSERAHLLGGTCEAGPDPQGGWTVVAELPLEVAR
ncbi:MAG TPA: histidine kinase [Nocardioidaceae bacterium]|nr:histidine kinase [Nocardioidaceae bacterium]